MACSECLREDCMEPPCIGCGRPLCNDDFTGDCVSACNEDCLDDAMTPESLAAYVAWSNNRPGGGA